MKIGCLQFAPKVGDIDNNLNRADAILNRSDLGDLDLLVLPELAFSGYNFKSLHDIAPFLEPTGAGITSVWARTTALKHNCKVVVGYPETADVSFKWPTSPEYYNSAIIVNEEGDTWGHYRKSHLYYTDETWALEGSGFFKGHVPGLGKISMGICMDINPYKFEAPWSAYEFAFHALDVSANVVVVSMAWLTREDASSFSCKPKEPDMDTLTYWISRMEPLIRSENQEEIIIIFANRTGIEDDAVYAGTSAVVGIQNGEVTVYGLLGRGEKELLVVDTSKPGFAKLVYRPGEEEELISAVLPGSEPRTPPGDEHRDAESSNGSDLSSGSFSNNQGAPDGRAMDPKISDAARDNSSIAVGNHVLVNSAVYDESPVSPRYFWGQPASGVPVTAQLPNVGVHDNYEDWRNSLRADQARDGDLVPQDSPGPRHADLDSGTEFSSLVDVLRDKTISTEAYIDRPGSTKSRNEGRFTSQNASSNARGEQLVDRPRRMTSNLHQHVQLPSNEVRHNQGKLPDHGSRNAIEKPERDAPQFSSHASSEMQQCPVSPDLERLGADLMVFEGEKANRSKRDSLVCHVDEDDYVTQRRDFIPKKKAVNSDERPTRSSSRNTPTHIDSLRHGSERTRTNSTAAFASLGDELSPERPMSRDRHRSDNASTPKLLSRKASRNKVASPLASGSDHHHTRQSPTEVRDVHRHERHGLSSMASPPSRRHRQEVPTFPGEHSRHKSPDPIVEHQVTVPIRTRKTYERDSYKTLAKGSSSSANTPVKSPPRAVQPSPGVYASSIVAVDTPGTGLTIPDRTPERMPPTPKAMVLPPDYDSGNGHQSVPPPPKYQAPVVPLKCLNQRGGIQADRPRSAVW
ncbi:Uu.00g087100.m01.CDS01 [Anthostomella pinea]|uniref:Uu.00g087100.m01.CDS01 n=1 Tax=Anthostomella pinea TaxID=933095 RepID=A0AAI8VM96_9PEZI|nr:Uu.00g087100.m01.CDS01 [Anthostomella pinea]